MKRTTIGVLIAVTAYIAWGTNTTFFLALLNLGMQEMTVVALAPTAVCLFFGIKCLVTDKSQFKLSTKGYIYVFIGGVVLINLQNLSYVKAVATVPVALVSIITFTNVVILLFMSRILFGYKLTSHKIMAIAVALFGVALVLNVFSTGGIPDMGSGLFWASLLPFIMAANFIFIKYALDEGVANDALLFYVNLFGAISLYVTVSSPVALFADVASIISVHGMTALGVVAGFVMIPCVYSYYGSVKAYEFIEPTYISLSMAFDPITSSICGLVFLGQVLTGTQIIGIVVIISAILYINYMEGKAESESLVEEESIIVSE